MFLAGNFNDSVISQHDLTTDQCQSKSTPALGFTSYGVNYLSRTAMFSSGTKLGSYEIRSYIGAGAMG
jgi:hypothetical protein